MKNTFTSNEDDVFSANQAQVKKIEFLTHEKQKTDFYIKDLEESLRFNKEAVRTINKEGPNNDAIRILIDENLYLLNRLQSYYEENRDLNALRLFEAQIRIQDKCFYRERVEQFQNRISDLRKYLHDKEDSFTNVVNRLRKYEDMSQLTIKEKLAEFTNQFNEYVHCQIVTQLSLERNKYKHKCDEYEMAPRKLQIVEFSIKNRKNYEEMKRSVEQFDKMRKSQIKIEDKVNEIIPEKVQKDIENLMQKKQEKMLTPNTQLIRLLKKERLSNQLLEQTLNDAIEKNEELLNYNEKLVAATDSLEDTCQELKSKILVLEGRLSEFDDNYRRRIRDYSKCDIDRPNYKYSDFANDVSRKGLMSKLKKDVESISAFMTSMTGKGKILGKSSSNPRIGADTGISEEDLQIQEV